MSQSKNTFVRRINQNLTASNFYASPLVRSIPTIELSNATAAAQWGLAIWHLNDRWRGAAPKGVGVWEDLDRGQGSIYSPGLKFIRLHMDTGLNLKDKAKKSLRNIANLLGYNKFTLIGHLAKWAKGQRQMEFIFVIHITPCLFRVHSVGIIQINGCIKGPLICISVDVDK